MNKELLDNYQQMLKNYREMIDNYTKRRDKILHILFAEYLNEELKLSEHKDELNLVNNKTDEYTFPFALATKIHQWIYDNKFELTCFNYNGVVFEINDFFHCATVIIRFENKDIFDEFQKTWKIDIASLI